MPSKLIVSCKAMDAPSLEVFQVQAGCGFGQPDLIKDAPPLQEDWN